MLFVVLTKHVCLTLGLGMKFYMCPGWIHDEGGDYSWLHVIATKVFL